MKLFRRLRAKWLVWQGKAVDVWSKSTYPANVLSNLHDNAFTFDGVECGSMEGFLQSLKYQDKMMQRMVCCLSGKEAKKKSIDAWKQDQTVYWKGQAIARESADFDILLLQAYMALYTQCVAFHDALDATEGKLLLHSAGNENPKDTILTEKEFCGCLVAVRDKEALVTYMNNTAMKGNVSLLFDIGQKLLFNIGQMFYKGDFGQPKDISLAIDYFTKAANAGLDIAAYQLGRIYETGDGVTADQTKSFEWYTRAAANGMAEAENNLGSCYFFGRGTEIDFKKAFELYAKSAVQDNIEAAMNVGICYASGRGIEQDYSQAFAWWKLAANRGHVKAMVNLATCYENGIGTKQDLWEAYEWYGKAAELGDAFAPGKVVDLRHEIYDV